MLPRSHLRQLSVLNMQHPLPSTSRATWKNRDGRECSGVVERLSPRSLVIGTINTGEILSCSETLDQLTLTAGDREIFQGRGVVASIVEQAGQTLYQITIDHSMLRVRLPDQPKLDQFCDEGCGQILVKCGQRERINSEFRLLVAEVADMLSGARSWLEQIECALTPEQWHNGWVDDFLSRVTPRVTGAFNLRHEKFEEIVERETKRGEALELVELYRDYTQAHWQQFFLRSPFGHRTYYKPLGYAGDYEMMSMIHRNRPEGETLFARLIHQLLVSQWPAESVRNRVLNIGCGPAWEIQALMKESDLVSQMDFTLLDFNEETLNYTGGLLRELKRQHGRRCTIETIQMSVYQLLTKGKSGRNPLPNGCDLVYCAGLYDYLAPDTCRHLVNYFHDILAPGGLVMVANMNDSKPFANFIEHILDWHLIYRNSDQMWTFAPPHLRANSEVIHEPTTVNLFLHVRKPLQ